MGILDPIVKALSTPGPHTDHSNHTTTQLPPQPMKGAVHTNQTKADTGSWEALHRGKNGPKPY